MDLHVVLRGHVARDTLPAFAASFVKMMLFSIEYGGVVAAYTQRVAFCPQFQCMRFVAIHAGDPARVHFALQKRTPGVDLVALLAVGVVKGLCEHCQAMSFVQRGARLPAFGDGRAAGMTRGTGNHSCPVRGPVAPRGPRGA